MSGPPSGNLSFRELYRKANSLERTATILGTWFGVGFFPLAPGTAGSLAAIPLAWALGYLGLGFRLLVVLGLAMIAIWASEQYHRISGQGDPSEVVIDEVAGYVLTIGLVPWSWVNAGIGFLAFRFFDIVKPFPANRAERLPGGLGIVADDLVAGLYAAGFVRLILLFFPGEL